MLAEAPGLYRGRQWRGLGRSCCAISPPRVIPLGRAALPAEILVYRHSIVVNAWAAFSFFLFVFSSSLEETSAFLLSFPFYSTSCRVFFFLVFYHISINSCSAFGNHFPVFKMYLLFREEVCIFPV